MFTLQSLPTAIVLLIGLFGLTVLVIRLITSVRTVAAARRMLSGRLADGVGLLRTRTAGVRYALDQRKHRRDDRPDSAGSNR